MWREVHDPSHGFIVSLRIDESNPHGAASGNDRGTTKKSYLLMKARRRRLN